MHEPSGAVDGGDGFIVGDAEDGGGRVEKDAGSIFGFSAVIEDERMGVGFVLGKRVNVLPNEGDGDDAGVGDGVWCVDGE